MANSTSDEISRAADEWNRVVDGKPKPNIEPMQNLLTENFSVFLSLVL